MWAIAKERTEKWREERIEKLRDGQRKKRVTEIERGEIEKELIGSEFFVENRLLI